MKTAQEAACKYVGCQPGQHFCTYLTAMLKERDEEHRTNEATLETIMRLEREHRYQLQEAHRVMRLALDEIVAEDYLTSKDVNAVTIADKALAEVSKIFTVKAHGEE